MVRDREGGREVRRVRKGKGVKLLDNRPEDTRTHTHVHTITHTDHRNHRQLENTEHDHKNGSASQSDTLQLQLHVLRISADGVVTQFLKMLATAERSQTDGDTIPKPLRC